MAFPVTATMLRSVSGSSKAVGEATVLAANGDLGNFLNDRAGEFTSATIVEVRVTESGAEVEGVNNPPMVIRLEFS